MRLRCKETSEKKAISGVLGAILLFGMIFTIAFSYFYLINQSQQIYQKTINQNYNLVQQQSSEHINIYAIALGDNDVAFSLNDSGIATQITAYWIFNSGGSVAQYRNVTNSPSIIPISIDQGRSYILDTGIVYSNGQNYVLKVLTTRGSAFVGYYPGQYQLTPQSVNSLVAGGLGSLQMVFSSFSFYSYLQNGPTYQIDLSHPHPGPSIPVNTNIVFSLQITNNDPNGGTLVLNSHTNLWSFLQCLGGCGHQTLLTFFIINVASDGTITSTSSANYNPITIPYGATSTLYFGSATDLSGATFSQQQLCTGSGCGGTGAYDIFLLFSGSKVTQSSSALYGQNIPFASTYASNDVFWANESPVSCTHSQSQFFSLNINNSQYSTDSITKVIVNASAFSSLSASVYSGWPNVINSGFITWTASGSGIAPNNYQTFNWSGTAPNSITTQLLIPITVSWSSGSTSQYTIGCYNT